LTFEAGKVTVIFQWYITVHPKVGVIVTIAVPFKTNRIFLGILLVVSASAGWSPTMAALPYQDPNLSADRRVEDLLGRMTLEEKVDQLNQTLAGDTNPNNIGKNPERFRPTFGSYLFNLGSLQLRNALQRDAVEKSRLGIPAIFGADVIHGYRTIFPIPLALACSWNPELVRQSCRVAAVEAKHSGVDWTFGPMIDLAFDPRWGRIAEGFGESPYAASIFCVAAVKGYQGDDLAGPDSIAACLKHFVGYGASEGGRDYSYTDISAQRLWEMYLPPYEAGVKAGAATVMSAFNDLNGVPTSANHEMLTEILRNRWGFKGFVVSDWFAIEQLTIQGFAADEREAVEKAIRAGVDMDMTDGLYPKLLPGVVQSGKVSQQVLDEAVRRVLRVKFALGLFERPYCAEIPDKQKYLLPESLKLAEEAAAQSIVLLKNEHSVLPLAGMARQVALIGPLADARLTLLGTWIQKGDPADVTSIADSLRPRLSSGVTLRTAEGCDIDSDRRDVFAEAIELAKASDVVLLCLGESKKMSGENASRSSIHLPGVQEELALELAKLGKPMVLVLSSGRPIELVRMEPKMDAILAIWQPGTCGGAAVADILLGRRNPSGRLSVTFPRTTGQIPMYHNMRPRARRGNQGAYQDIPSTPLYPFGHGLSYTRFDYSPVKLSSDTVAAGGQLVAEVTVSNTGQRDGAETVFWYIHQPAASITRPLKELKHFEKAEIAAGQSRVFRFTIDPDRDLSFPDAQGKRICDAGEMILMAGPQEAHFRLEK
jgi:beta-glucosidase